MSYVVETILCDTDYDGVRRSRMRTGVFYRYAVSGKNFLVQQGIAVAEDSGDFSFSFSPPNFGFFNTGGRVKAVTLLRSQVETKLSSGLLVGKHLIYVDADAEKYDKSVENFFNEYEKVRNTATMADTLNRITKERNRQVADALTDIALMGNNINVESLKEYADHSSPVVRAAVSRKLTLIATGGA